MTDDKGMRASAQARPGTYAPWRRRTSLTMIALVIVLAMFAAACGGDDDDDATSDAGSATTEAESQPEGADASPGITDTEIVLGSSSAFSGPVAAAGVINRGIEGYVNYVNSLGGVEMGDGKTRTIKIISLDDAYSPPQAVQNVQRLVERDEVFALVGNFGASSNLAVRDYTNEHGVPQMFISSGSPAWGRDVADYPMLSGFEPTYATEAAIYAEFLRAENPEAKVAILYQNDDYGKTYLGAFKRGLEGSDIEVVEEQSYESTDPTVDSQITALAATKADVFLNISAAKFAALAIRKAGELQWKPMLLLNGLAASIESVIKPAGEQYATNVYSTLFLKDPTDPRWKDDPGIMKYRERAKEFGEFEPDDLYGAWGWAMGEALVAALEKMEAPTRDAFVSATRSLKGLELSTLLPGITFSMDGTDDPFPIETMEIARFKDGSFELTGKTFNYEGKTGSLLE